MEKAEEYYKAFVTSNNIVSEFNIPAEHSMVCYIAGCISITMFMLDRPNYDRKKIHTLGLFILTTFTRKSILQ